MILGLSLLLLRDTVKSCFRVVPILLLVGVRVLLLLAEIPGGEIISCRHIFFIFFYPFYFLPDDARECFLE